MTLNPMQNWEMCILLAYDKSVVAWIIKNSHIKKHLHQLKS